MCPVGVHHRKRRLPSSRRVPSGYCLIMQVVICINIKDNWRFLHVCRAASSEDDSIFSLLNVLESCWNPLILHFAELLALLEQVLATVSNGSTDKEYVRLTMKTLKRRTWSPTTVYMYCGLVLARTGVASLRHQQRNLVQNISPVAQFTFWLITRRTLFRLISFCKIPTETLNMTNHLIKEHNYLRVANSQADLGLVWKTRLQSCIFRVQSVALRSTFWKLLQ